MTGGLERDTQPVREAVHEVEVGGDLGHLEDRPVIEPGFAERIEVGRARSSWR